MTKEFSCFTVLGLFEFAGLVPRRSGSEGQKAVPLLCAGGAFAKWPTAKAKQVVELTRKLEDVSDVRKLIALLG
jgi:hypothetical protein